MQDRISNHPNRWVLTPVEGETNTYDLTRADDPTQVGTPLNTATFLPAAVASAVEDATGATDVNLPADALGALAAAIGEIGIGNNAKIDVGSYVGTGTVSMTTYLDLTFAITPKVVFFATEEAASISWYYNMTGGRSNISYVEWAQSGRLLRRRASQSSATAQHLANKAGTTYYYIAIGET